MKTLIQNKTLQFTAGIILLILLILWDCSCSIIPINSNSALGKQNNAWLEYLEAKDQVEYLTRIESRAK